ncbi:3080_t:CDS:2, partial [Dentiscutata erythropus]
ILPEVKQNEVENIASDNYQDDNYIMFGYLIVNNKYRISIRFSLSNRYGCQIIVHKSKNTSIPVGARVFWIMLAKGHGYFSRHTRNIKFVHGVETLSGKLPFTCNISMLNSGINSLSDSFIFTNFESKDLNKTLVLQGRLKGISNTNLNMQISESNVNEIQNNNLLDIAMRWCVVDTYQRSYIVTDIGEESFKLNDLKGL